MFAPQIKNLAFFGRQGEGENALVAPSHQKLDERFGAPDRFEAVGDDNLHGLRLRTECNPIEAFGDVEGWLKEGEVPSQEEIESCWQEAFPRERPDHYAFLPHDH